MAASDSLVTLALHKFVTYLLNVFFGFVTFLADHAAALVSSH